MIVPGRLRSPSRTAAVLRLTLACLLGVAAALLIACGSSGKGLIPAAQAGPLQQDFEEVEQKAQTANGNCTATEAALLKTDQDFAALPTTVDSGLRNTLRQGITNLRKVALEQCAQPLVQTTTTGTTPKTTTTQTTPTTTTPTTTTPTTTTPTTTTTAPETPGPGGGTPAPGEEGAGSEGNPGGAGGVNPGGQEAGK